MECNKSEHRLKALNTVKKSYEEERSKESQETLAARSVTLEEVRRDLEGWKEALRAEYKSSIDHGAIRRLSEEEFQQVKGVNDEVITIPGMLVATLKPPSRRKARVVACGNYVQESHTKQEVSAGALDSMVTRSLIALASRKKWSLATADVKTAFLQANERWLVTKVLYGLVESPRPWDTHHDAQLKKMKWTDDRGKEVRIMPTAEPRLYGKFKGSSQKW